MDEILKIWDLIVKSNTFNFAILVLLFAVIASKLNLSEKIEHIKNEIIKAIENAKSEKEKAIKFLDNTQKDVEHIEDEIKERLEKAHLHARIVAKQILDQAGQKASRFEDGISRRIAAEEKTVSAALSKQAATAAVELAKDHIKHTLENNTELHKKFINDSINELDRIEF